MSCCGSRNSIDEDYTKEEFSMDHPIFSMRSRSRRCPRCMHSMSKCKCRCARNYARCNRRCSRRMSRMHRRPGCGCGMIVKLMLICIVGYLAYLGVSYFMKGKSIKPMMI